MSNAARRAILLSLTLVLSVGAATADASPLVAGQTITVQNGPGNTGGGEFTIVVDPLTSFITFCLQQTEYISFGPQFYVDAISTYAVTDPSSRGGVGGKDYISSETAYLYTAFRALTLAGYDYSGANHVSSADALQNAFWMFEQEIAMDSSNPFVMAANTAVTSGAWSGIGDVRVMNLSRDGVEAQDQLMLEPGRDITAVPEPASLVLFGTGSAMAAFARRRNRRQAAKNS